MESGAVNNFHVIVKQINNFDGRRADEFLEWDSKLCTRLSVYNKTVFNVLQGQKRPSEFEPTRRPLARPGMPRIKTYTACTFSSQLV